MDNLINTPDLLRQAREQLGLSQTALAEKLGMTRDAVAKMEAGARPIRRSTGMAIQLLLQK